MSSIPNPRNFDIGFVSTPNKSRRLPLIHPKPQVALIHHTASNILSGTISHFQNRTSKVSADFTIGKNGEIVRMIPKGWMAWHAGQGTFAGKVLKNYNAISYGIELVNLGNYVDPYSEIQLEAMAYVIAVIQEECPTVQLIRRHQDIAYPPGRKIDPAGLTISQIYSAVWKHQPQVILK